MAVDSVFTGAAGGGVLAVCVKKVLALCCGSCVLAGGESMVVWLAEAQFDGSDVVFVW